MVYLTQFSIPALLNPMINKMTDVASAILLLICSHEVWVKVTYAYVHPVFTSQSYDISISTSTRRANLSVFLANMLMSTQFSLAYTCACACAYDHAYALVKTSLQGLMDFKRHRCAFSIHQNEQRASLDSREADGKISQNKTTNIVRGRKTEFDLLNNCCVKLKLQDTMLSAIKTTKREIKPFL